MKGMFSRVALAITISDNTVSDNTVKNIVNLIGEDM
jgi:hypothetical protein